MVFWSSENSVNRCDGVSNLIRALTIEVIVTIEKVRILHDKGKVKRVEKIHD